MRTIAIVNQKGGCGKTTTTVNLAGCLEAEGMRILVVDMDPQAHATLALGIDPEALDENLYEVLAEPDGAARLDRVVQIHSERIHVAPSGIVLSALEQKLTAERADARTERLQAALTTVADRYDYALIDCPPNIGVLTFNALRAATEVIVPLETSYFAIQGVHKLLETIALLADRIGHDPAVRILPTLYDGRTRFARETLAEIRELFKDLCFDTVIRSNVRLREAARRGQPINRFARVGQRRDRLRQPRHGGRGHASPADRAAGQASPRGGAGESGDRDPVPKPERDRCSPGGRLQRLGSGQGHTVDGPDRGSSANLDQDPDPAARDLRVSIRGRRRMV